MPFPVALKNFSEKGFFELKNSEFSSENSRDLEKAIEQLKKQNQFNIPLRLRLKGIQMIPDVPRRKHGSGLVIQHVPRRWTDSYSDLAISQMGSFQGFNLPMNYGDAEEIVWHPEEEKTPLEILQETLLSLLTQPWRTIELDQLFFCPYHQVDAKATQDFYNELLKSLSRNSSLKQLSITPFSLSKYRDNLISFLATAKLEHLHLDITEADPSSWEAFCQVLERHSSLQSLNLGNSALDSFAYKALANLLDKNYKIKITLPEPTDAELLSAYQPLKKRLSKPGLERFKEKYLTQDRLFQIAIKSLELLKKLKLNNYQATQQAQLEKQFEFLLKGQAALAFTDGNYTDVLHRIYQEHHHLIDEESPYLVQLHLNTLPANKTKTMGSILLEKALETNNQRAIQTLLNANANLFEFHPHEDEPFLVKVLQNSGTIKELVLDHIRQYSQLEESDLFQLQIADGSKTIGYVLLEKALKTQNPSALKALLNIHVNLFEYPDNNEEPFLVKVLQSKGILKRMVVEYIQQDQQIMNLAIEFFGPSSKLKNLFGEFKDHLDNYGAQLVKRDNPSLLVSIAKKILMTWRQIVDFENPSDKRGQECAEMYLNLNECLQVSEQELTLYNFFDKMHKIIIKMKENSTEAIRGFFNSSFLHEKSLKLITKFEYELLDSKKSVFDKSINQIKEAREQDRLVFNEQIEMMKTENAEMRKTQAQMEAQIHKLSKQMGAHGFFPEAKPPLFNLPNQANNEAQGAFQP